MKGMLTFSDELHRESSAAFIFRAKTRQQRKIIQLNRNIIDMIVILALVGSNMLYM